ncbi:hypothetical protein J3459_006144 [Metarhizium acridum]|uniref:uncharacterized protein n=1 Tax=Metarhizium acridum TaxID=92637 RepID=UPI001C6C6895|nr:hypothetical protein J3458_005397 [Metarhizium acridum]KAG8428013.1 hypothetical protein J3459_006144 [Metarhizium acridum]
MTLPILTGLKELASWLFGKNPEYRGLMMGFEAAGKTTLLYQLKLPDEKITTIPTIGLNVETVESTKGHKFTLWDVGGVLWQNASSVSALLSKYGRVLLHRRLRRHLQIRRGRPRGQSLLNELDNKHGKKNLRVILNKQDLLPPHERDEAVKQIRTKLERGLSRSVESGRVRIFGPPGFNAFEHGHAAALLDEVADAIQADKSPILMEKHDRPVSSHVGETELREHINEIAKRNTASADDFWQGFLNADLPVWDHYNHLRAGYFVLLEGTACANTYNDDIWLFQLQVATIRYVHFKRLIGLTSREDFPQILLHTPEHMDAGLWKVHYSKDLMFTPSARANWVLPDKSPLPSTAQPVQHESSPRDVLQADSDHLIRFALTVIQSSRKQDSVEVR